jgi:hypothetical protein
MESSDALLPTQSQSVNSQNKVQIGVHHTTDITSITSPERRMTGGQGQEEWRSSPATSSASRRERPWPGCRTGRRRRRGCPSCCFRHCAAAPSRLPTTRSPSRSAGAEENPKPPGHAPRAVGPSTSVPPVYTGAEKKQERRSFPPPCRRGRGVFCLCYLWNLERPRRAVCCGGAVAKTALANAEPLINGVSWAGYRQTVAF